MGGKFFEMLSVFIVYSHFIDCTGLEIGTPNHFHESSEVIIPMSSTSTIL